MLHLPARLPAAAVLRSEGYAVSEYPVGQPPAGPAQLVGVLNLMPLKEVTELDIFRAVAPDAGDAAVSLMLLKFPGQTYKNTPQHHMDTYYVPVARFLEAARKAGPQARLIVTGAPLEQIPFEDVRYWPQLCDLMDEAARRNLYTLYICWGAQAALYHRYGIPKRLLPNKQFGIYPQRVLSPGHPLVAHLAPAFPMPVSRHTDIAVPAPLPAGLRLLAASDVTGEAILADTAAVYITGHLEYEPLTLHKEYLRDRSRNLPISPAVHYYPDDDPALTPPHTWSCAARALYRAFLQGAAPA